MSSSWFSIEADIDMGIAAGDKRFLTWQRQTAVMALVGIFFSASARAH
jgi:hypothetical protein